MVKVKKINKLNIREINITKSNIIKKINKRNTLVSKLLIRNMRIKMKISKQYTAQCRLR